MDTAMTLNQIVSKVGKERTNITGGICNPHLSSIRFCEEKTGRFFQKMRRLRTGRNEKGLADTFTKEEEEGGRPTTFM